jgi:2-amino-4-hydroxy-6-hydroxymethyldihydropteridine diphosphokinase
MIFGIALGSNLGDRASNLRRGIELLILRTSGCRITAKGGVYETEPVDCAPGTQAFLNSVIEIEAPCTPQEIHSHLAAIEIELGRAAERQKNASRTLDLDLLYAGDVVSDDPLLVIPHPRLHLRRFVLQPLADIRPDLKLPGHDRTIAEHLAALQDDPSCVKRVAESC